MLELPVAAKIDEKNGIIDGRDYAMKCIMLAYRVLGAYADGDEDTYRALKKIIHHQAQLELHMNDEDEPNDLMVLNSPEFSRRPRCLFSAAVRTRRATASRS